MRLEGTTVGLSLWMWKQVQSSKQMWQVRAIRFRRHKRVLGYLSFVLVVCLYAVVLWHKLGGSAEDRDLPIKCYQGEEELVWFEQLAIRTKDSLETLKVTHFLCYDSLWGALKHSGPLPWQRNLDFCALNEDLSSNDEGFIIKSFKQNGLHISYNGQNGYYKIFTNHPDAAYARLFVFSLDSVTGKYRRIGWKNRLILPSNCELLHCFPPELVSKPLSSVQFINQQLPAPHDQEEIQKYLYPDSWWKDLEPKLCKIR